MPSSLNSSSFSSVAPCHPTHAPSAEAMTGARAVTSPPGERRHSALPSSAVTRSTGSRLATTTKSKSPVTAFFSAVTGARRSRNAVVLGGFWVLLAVLGTACLLGVLGGTSRPELMRRAAPTHSYGALHRTVRPPGRSPPRPSWQPH